MPDTLRDELARTLRARHTDNAYTQADAIIDILNQWDAEHSETGDTAWDAAVERVRDAYPGWLISSISRLSSGVLTGIIEEAERVLQDRRASGSFE